MRDAEKYDQGQEREKQVGCGAGEGDEIFVAPDLAEVARDYGRGLGPSDEHAAEHLKPRKGPKIAMAGKSSVPMGST